MPTTDVQSSPAHPKRKSTSKRLSNFRRRFSKIVSRPDLEKEQLSYDKFNRNSSFVSFNHISSLMKQHQRSASDTCFETFNNGKFEEVDFFNEYEETIQQYVPIFTRNKRQMSDLPDYEEPTNEVISEQQIET